MNVQFADRYFGRTVFVIATTTILLAFAEGIAELFGRSLLAYTYSPGRLLEIAATLLIFVIVQLLRQIREELSSARSNDE